MTLPDLSKDSNKDYVKDNSNNKNTINTYSDKNLIKNDNKSFKLLNNSQSKNNIKKSWLYHNREISKMLKLRNDNQILPVPIKRGYVVRQHGCIHCPYWGTSKCYHELHPPIAHRDGICLDRLNEILDYAELGASVNGRDIKRAEVIERVRDHIILLESNLGEYRKKKYETLLYDRDESGKLVQIKKFEQLELKDIKFDTYEQMMMDRINQLSMAYHQEMRKDTQFEKTLDEEKKRTKVFNIQEMNQYMNNAAQELLKLESIDADFREVDD